MSRDRISEVTHFLLRVVSGLLFMQAGGNKIFDWFGGIPEQFGGHPATWSQTWIGGVIEFTCGLLIMLGFLTRPAAFLASGTMAVAYFQFHFKPELFWPLQNQGVPAVVLCFVFLMFAARGAGPWSLDRALLKKDKASASPE